LFTPRKLGNKEITAIIVEVCENMLSVTKHRFFLIGLLIWLIPGFVLWGFIALGYPTGISFSMIFSIIASLFVLTVLFFPAFLFYGTFVTKALPIGSFVLCMCYYVISYLVIFYYRKKSTF